MQEDLGSRDQQLEQADATLVGMLKAAGDGSAVESVAEGLGAPRYFEHFQASDRAPVAGLFSAHHMAACIGLPKRIYTAAEATFPLCRQCGTRVFYRFVKALE